MNSIRFIILLLCGSLRAGAQLVPEFEMPIYFEDARGNRDSVVVGYDRRAEYFTLNPQFGEFAISRPFDSIFEVRAIKDFDINLQTSKRIINYLEHGQSCFASSAIKIMISAKYFPLRITYNAAPLYNDFCKRNTLLYPDILVRILQYFWKARVYYCMAFRNEIVDSMSYYFKNPDVAWLRELLPVEGKGAQYLPGYYFQTSLNFGECEWLAPVASYPTTPDVWIKAYPNPTAGNLRLAWGSALRTPARVCLYDLTGRLVRTVALPPGQQEYDLDLYDLPPGIYAYAVYAGERIAAGKVVRM